MNVWEGTGAQSEARRFCELWGIEGTVLADEEGELVDRLGVRGVPTNVFVDSDGTVMAVGGSTPLELQALAGQLLGASGGIAEATATATATDWHWQKDADHIERHIAAWEDPGVSGPGAPGAQD